MTKSQIKILHHLGLHAEMPSIPDEKPGLFIKYLTDEYLKSDLRPLDEVYKMFELNLLQDPHRSLYQFNQYIKLL